MKFEHLHYFVSVVHCSSINKAAKKLFISQPTLTSIIKNLENDLGYPLIERSHKGIVLTPRGEKVYEDAQKILAMEQEWRAMAEQEPEAKGDVHITILPSVSPYVVNRCTALLKKEYPEINVIFHEGRMKAQLTHLTKNIATIGLLGHLPEERQNIAQFANQQKLTMTGLFTDKFCVFVNPNHPLVQKKEISVEDLKTLPVAIYAGEDPVAPYFLQYFNPDEYYCINNLNAMLTMAINNNIAAVSTALYAYQNPLIQTGLLKMLHVPAFNLPFQYSILYPQAQFISPAEAVTAQTLQEILLDSFSDYNPD